MFPSSLRASLWVGQKQENQQLQWGVQGLMIQVHRILRDPDGKVQGEKMLGVCAQGSVWMTLLVIRSQEPHWRASPELCWRGAGQEAHAKSRSLLRKEFLSPLGVVGEGWEIWSYMIKYAFKKVTLNCVKDELERRHTGHKRSFSKGWLLSRWETRGQADATEVRIESKGSTSWTVYVIQLTGFGGQWLENRL